MKRFQTDFSSIILEEIALEGLDGITIEGKQKKNQWFHTFFFT